MGIASGADCAPAAGDPDVYSVAGGDRAHATAEVSRVHVHWVVAVVLRSRLCRNEVGGAMEQRSETEDMVPSHGRRDSGGVDHGNRVLRMVTPARPGAGEFGQRGISSTPMP